MSVDLNTPTRFEHTHMNLLLTGCYYNCVSHLPSNPGSGRREETCFSRVDQGPLVIVGACVLTEEHHDVFHINGTCDSGFEVREGGWMEEREGGEEGWRKGEREGGRDGGREGGRDGWRKGGGKRRKGRGGSEELGGNHK